MDLPYRFTIQIVYWWASAALQVAINHCKPAAWQLTGPDEVLDVLLSASGRRPAGAYVLVASSIFLTQLAEWVVLTLGRLLQGCEGSPPDQGSEVSWLALEGFAACCRPRPWLFACLSQDSSTEHSGPSGSFGIRGAQNSHRPTCFEDR